MWLTKLKIAIIEKDVDTLSKLMDAVPKLKSVVEMNEAVYLIREASQLVHTLQDETLDSMKQIKKNLNFLKVTELQKPSRLDIIS